MDVPPDVVTRMSTVPVVPVGIVAVIDESEMIVKELAGVLPNTTLVVPRKWLPEIVTEAPPPGQPEEVLNPLMVGKGMGTE